MYQNVRDLYQDVHEPLRFVEEKKTDRSNSPTSSPGVQRSCSTNQFVKHDRCTQGGEVRLFERSVSPPKTQRFADVLVQIADVLVHTFGRDGLGWVLS